MSAGEAAPAPASARRDRGGLAGPLLSGVLGEHGLDDLRDSLHDVSFSFSGAAGAMFGGEAPDAGLASEAEMIVTREQSSLADTDLRLTFTSFPWRKRHGDCNHRRRFAMICS